MNYTQRPCFLYTEGESMRAFAIYVYMHRRYRLIFELLTKKRKIITSAWDLGRRIVRVHRMHLE